MFLCLSEVSLSRVDNAFTARGNFSFEASPKKGKVNELCFAVVVFCFLFP